MRKLLIAMMIAAVVIGCFGCKKEEKAVENSQPEKVEEKAQEKPQEKPEESEQAEYEAITQTEAKELIETDEAPVILDVRSFEEFEKGHVKDAICFPAESLSETITMLLPNQEQLVLIYADTKEKSKTAAEKMVELGYKNVKDFGEIKDWKGELEK